MLGLKLKHVSKRGSCLLVAKLLPQPMLNHCQIWIKIYKFNFMKMHLKMSSAKCWKFYSGLNVLTHWGLVALWSMWTLVQMMTCCLMTPSHYMNQCWHIIRGVLRHSLGVNQKLLMNMWSVITLLKWLLHLLLLTWINFNPKNPSMDYNFTTIIKCRMKLHINSRTSTV